MEKSGVSQVFLVGQAAAYAQAVEVDIERGCAIEAENFGVCCATEDKAEGTAAFVEKRKPVFKGQ